MIANANVAIKLTQNRLNTKANAKTVLKDISNILNG